MGKPHELNPANSAMKLPSHAISKQETTITLKVLIHCEGCRRKVKRIIRFVDGVEAVNIEGENGKVTVFGHGVDAKDVLYSLHKAGKHAEVWQFGGGKALGQLNHPNNNKNNNNNKPINNFNNNNNNNNSNNNTHNNMKSLGGLGKLNLEDNKSFHPKGKGNEGNNPLAVAGMNPTFGGKMKGGENMLELSNLVPQKPPFPSGAFTSGGHFEKPSLPSNNVAILSKSVAPMPSVYHGETSQSAVERSEYETAEYATHLFSDENANNCSVM